MKLYLIVGEDSGDLHGANLIKSLRKLHPELAIRGVGGDHMAEQGMELIEHIRQINFMGFWEVVRNLKSIRRLFSQVKADILAWKPEAVVLVDYPGFNLRIARFIHKHQIPVYYYISPQLWAWKKGRVKTIRRYIRRMFVILPFEREFYRQHGVEVDFVGHPLLDAIDTVEPLDTHRPVVALLPGSRKQEIKRILPTMLQVVRQFRDCEFIIAGAPSQSADFYQGIIGDAQVGLVMNQTYKLLRKASFALVTSGTATLETALFRVPQVVCYKGASLSYHIGKRLVQVPFISLVNLILNKKAVTELIQNECTADRLVTELKALSSPEKQEALADSYNELRNALGETGASIRTAQLLLDDIAKT